MSWVDYTIAMASVAIVVAALALASRCVTKRLLPRWVGAPAVLASGVVGVTLVTLTSEALGTVGLLERWILTPVLIGVALAAILFSRRIRPLTDAALPAPKPAPRRVVMLSAVLVALALAQWSGRSFEAITTGIVEADSIAQHLPASADFFQEGSTTELYHPATDGPWAFYPQNSELVHAVSMVLTGRDILSPFINLGWLAMFLLASWCALRRWGTAPLATGLAAALALSPLAASTQPGTAHNDIPALALFQAAVAFVMLAPSPHTDRGRLALIGCAAGSAVAMKLSLVAPVGALALCMLVVARGAWTQVVRWFGVPLVVCGGYWYVRNALIVGNPVPAVHLPGLPSPSVPLVEGPRGRSVADYLLDAEVWREVFVPGTAHAFGALWPVLLGAIIVAIGMGLRRSADRVVRLLAGVVAVATLGYLITPTTAFSDGDRVLAHFFEANLRYAFPAIALATLLVCATAAARRWQVPALVVVGVAVVVSVASSSTFDIWPEWELAWAAVLATGIAALATWMVMDRRPAWIRQPAVNAMLALGCIGVFLAGFVLQRHHYTNRYSSDLWPASPALIGMRNVEGAEIAVGGGFFHIYPLVGADLSNHVDRVGISQPHHGLTRPSSCRAWRHALQARRYDFVVLAPSFEPEADPPERGWTRSDRSAVRVTIDEDRASAFQLVGRPDPTTCEEAETS